ncbi:hypothetical protein HDU76_011325, partial [Blyttiomyces sp. JEL0837]
IANELDMDPNTLVLIYLDSGFRVKIKTDRILQEALNETSSFIVEGTPLAAHGASASNTLASSMDSVSAAVKKIGFSVTVDHLESHQRIEMQLYDPGMTMKEFQDKIAEEMDLKGDLAVFYVELGFKKKSTATSSFRKH